MENDLKELQDKVDNALLSLQDLIDLKECRLRLLNESINHVWSYEECGRLVEERNIVRSDVSKLIDIKNKLTFQKP